MKMSFENCSECTLVLIITIDNLGVLRDNLINNRLITSVRY